MKQTVTVGSARAISILDDSERRTTGLFAVVAGSGIFPPARFLDAYLEAGIDALDGRKDADWTPFTLVDDEFEVVRDWWFSTHPGAREDDLGTDRWPAWQEALLVGDEWVGLGAPSTHSVDDDWAELGAPSPAIAPSDDEGCDLPMPAAATKSIPVDDDFAGWRPGATPFVAMTSPLPSPSLLPVSLATSAGAMRCPCCGEQTIPLWRKLVPFSDEGNRCVACHRVWTVSPWSAPASLLVAGGFLAAATLKADDWPTLAWGGLAAAAILVVVRLLLPAVRA